MVATTAEAASSTRVWPLQTALTGAREPVERWLEAERDQLPLWLPVMLGVGVTAWFVLPHADDWRMVMLGALAAACLGAAGWRGGRAGVAVAVAGVAVASGVGLAWWRAERVAHPVLARPAIVRFQATVDRVEPVPARDMIRLRLTPTRLLPGTPDARPGSRPRPPVSLPRTVRVNVATPDMPGGIGVGAAVEVNARLMPPNAPGVPTAYDFAEVAWFDRLGATGRASPPIKVLHAVPGTSDGLRARLTRHIEARLPGSDGGVAAAFVTGDVGAISLEDSDAMRRAGLAHLLSISGLHITAAVAATMLVALRLLALVPALALRFRLPMVAAGVGAAAAIGYTLLSGAEVPTVRSCVAALLVLAALALGREAVTLRLVAAGATAVLLLWPEALAGPSFQLSFAAVASIIAFNEHAGVRALFMKRDEAWWRKLARELASLVATGLLVEFALMPIAVYHFHRAGLYGAFANIVAIPLSTFVIMPAEALALVLDGVGIGAPAWWLAGRSIALLLWIARVTARQPGAVTVLPSTPDLAFALMVVGGLWIALWRTKLRRWGAVPLAVGAAWALWTPPPDLLVTGDGQHLALRAPDGGLAILRDKAGDYTRDMLTVNGGVDGDPELLSDQPTARCNRDLCLATRRARGREWRVLATRSNYHPDAKPLTDLCAKVDIIVTDRRLPRACRPRWLLLDRDMLRRSGGVAITFATGRIQTVLTPGDEHPWAKAAIPISRSGGAGRRAFPERGPGRGRNAGDHRRGWRDRAAPSPPHGGNI